MLPESCLISFLLIYKNYIKYYKYINIKALKSFYKELHLIYVLIPKYFERHEGRDTTLANFALFFFDYYPRLKPEEQAIYANIFEQASKHEVSEEIAKDYLRNHSERVQALGLAQAAIAVSEGREDVAALRQALQSFENDHIQAMDIPEEFIPFSIKDLKDSMYSKPGLRWRLGSMNKALGSLRRGDFGFVFKRPETGGTTFLASEVTHMATQTDRPILWFNNEEQGGKVALRCMQAALGVTLTELYSNPDKWQELYLNVTGDRIKIKDEAIIYKGEVERLCKEYNPSLIIFDQLDKIHGFTADRNDLVMGAIYQWAREIAKTYAPVIAVCQADGSGDGVKFLHMGNVADAKTAKQSEADWMLGIGKVYDEAFENVRYFHLSKNKLTGDPDTDPTMRHGKWETLIEPEIARYRDLG